MKIKNNMKLNYRGSSSNRNNGGGNKAFLIIVIILSAILLGLVFNYIKGQIGSKRDDKRGDNSKIEDIELKEQRNNNEVNTDEPKIVDNINEEEINLLEEADTLDETDPLEEVDPFPMVEVPETKSPVKAKGIYVTSKVANNNKLNRLIEIIETTEINAMVIDVKDDEGRITYRTNSQLAKEIGADSSFIPDIDSLIKRLKDKNIYLIARIVAFKDPFLAEKRQDLAIKNKDGTLYRDNRNDCWVNPYQQEVWDYLIDVSTQAAIVGFDEIQFDYIRFSTGKGMSDVEFGEMAKELSKEEIILEFTKYAYERLKPLDVFVSADVYGAIISSSIDAGLVGQNYIEMSKYLDYICPMIYPSHFGDGNYGIQYPDLDPYNIIRKVLLASKSKLDQIPEGEHRAIVRPWLQDFTASWLKNYKKYGAKEIRDQINGVYDAGYEEWILWNSNCNYTVEGLVRE